MSSDWIAEFSAEPAAQSVVVIGGVALGVDSGPDWAIVGRDHGGGNLQRSSSGVSPEPQTTARCSPNILCQPPEPSNFPACNPIVLGSKTTGLSHHRTRGCAGGTAHRWQIARWPAKIGSGQGYEVKGSSCKKFPFGPEDVK